MLAISDLKKFDKAPSVLHIGIAKEAHASSCF
jgi:hypothetical protein